MKNIKLIAMDLDGTLTQHKTPLSEECEQTLKKLSERYKLLMVGAGTCRRIFNQLREFPIDIIGNYGMQVALYDEDARDIKIVLDEKLPCDRESVSERARAVREKYGFTEYSGDPVEFHPSGCVTLPLLGTAAKTPDKLAFDPTRERRRAIYGEICELFSDYTVFVGGSSSFDMAPAPYDKAYALSRYCADRGILHSEVVFIGDDYGMGGNDEAVFKSDFNFFKIDNYLDFSKVVEPLLG
jgi:HAD superfamily hydrolase (TIGR01484 family)